MTKEENIATLNEHLEHWKRLLSEKICDQDEGEKTIDALQNAIKALEQQPTDAVDRVTIKEYLYNLGMGIKVTATDDVLDKIRAEIEETYQNITYQENKDRKATWGLRKALEIIDKYKAEGSEE